MSANNRYIELRYYTWLESVLPLSDRYKEELKSLPAHYECSSDDYSMIAKNIPQFQAINLLPISLDPSRLYDGRGIGEKQRKVSPKLSTNV